MPSAKIYFQMDVSLPGGAQFTIGDKSAPEIVTLDSTSPDAHRARYYIANNAEQEVLSAGSGQDVAAFKIAAFRPSVTMFLGWRTANSDADNSVVELRAGVWFLLVNDASKVYNAALATRIDNASTSSDISSVYAANASGGTGYIDVVAVN